MKKVVFIFAFVMMCITANAQVSPEMNKKWGAVMDAIEQVESRGDTRAVSPNGKWVGCMQISEILVIFQEKYNKEGNMEKAIRLWNSGDLNCMQRKASTNGYYRRVMASYNNLARNK